MKEHWKPGMDITAERLESMRRASGTQTYFGGPGVSQTSAMHAATGGFQSNKTKLVVSIERFEKRLSPDISTGVYDEAPSARVRDVLLNTNPADGDVTKYQTDTTGGDFRVWDPIAGLTGIAGFGANVPFHVIFNSETDRWEVLRQGIEIRHGLVCRCIGPGWYVVQLMDQLGVEPPEIDPDCAYASDRVNQEGISAWMQGCDLCDLTDCGGDDLTAEDPVVGEFNPRRPGAYDETEVTANSCPGTLEPGEEIIYAYDKRAIPLKIGGQVTVLYIGDTFSYTPTSGSGSESVEGDPVTVKLYMVMSGEYMMVAIPHEEWECGSDGVPALVSRTTFLVEGVACVQQLTSGSTASVGTGDLGGSWL